MNKDYSQLEHIHSEQNYKILYLKYKSKYIKLKELEYSILNKHVMIGGDNLINLYKNSINDLIIEIENIILNTEKNTEKNIILINLTNKLSDYLIDNDIPINIQLNGYNIIELKESIKELKNQLQNIDKIYDIRNKIYTMEELNMNEILDYIIDQFKITSISNIENLFTLHILGYNKNYIIFYMVLLRWLIANKIQLSFIDNYISILSFYSLKSCLDTQLNSDEYLPMILILLTSYINSFPIKKVLLIKQPKEIVKNITEFRNDTNQNLIKFDTKNKILQYESGNIKEAIKLTFDDLFIILYNLFRL
jgi:hypothetical protein